MWPNESVEKMASRLCQLATFYVKRHASNKKQAMKSLKVLGQTGWLGAIVAALGCASCFPLLGALGASLGLGFLSQFEGVLVTFLLPLFVGLGLYAGIAAWRTHGRVLRGILGVAGPVLAFLSMYVFFGFGWGQYLLMFSLFFMALFSVWGLLNPPKLEQKIEH